MGDKKVIVVGAGIGGLAAGCYAQMNGYETHIIEKHVLPGGVCTAWKRRGYTFDGCIHHLSGCSQDSKLYQMWAELGALPRPMYYPEDLIAVEDVDGRRFTVYTDIDRLEAHMLELSPGDAPAIREFTAAARRFTRFNLMDLVLAKPLDMARLLPNMGLLSKWGKVTLEQYGQRFNDSFLRRAFPMIQYDFSNIPALVALIFLGGCAKGYMGWPAGGALEFARSIERRFRGLGGQVHYGAPVSQVLVEPGPGGKNDRATGVRLEDGTEQLADYVISNADGRTTIFDMLGGKYQTPLVRTFYEHAPERQEMGLHVSLGIARDLSKEPHALVLWLAEPVCIGGEPVDRLDLELFGFAREMAPAGKSVMKALFTTSYAYWEALRAWGEDYYEAEKQRAAEVVIQALEHRFPGLAGQVEVADVATPLTTERYVGSYHGLQAWPVPNQGFVDAISGKGVSKTLPGLDNFYLAGQWAGGLGIPNVAAMGRKTVQAICKQDGRRFESTLPDGR